jgi:tol-pal system protein YbgF
MKGKWILCLPICVSFLAPMAQAGTKEEIMRLQNDVLALKDQFREFEKSYNEKNDGLKSLVVQLNDQVAKSTLLLDRVAKTLEGQASGTRASDQALLQEIRNLAAKVDDAATRISALAQQIADLKVQSKSLNESRPSSAELSEDSIYGQAYNDYVQGNLDMAIQGFSAYLASFPNGKMAANAQLSVGDAYTRVGKLPQAIAAFTRVITDYPGADQVPSAIFKRARAELAMKESDNAIADFKDIITRFPTAPESDQAKAELQKLGVNITKPAPAKVPRRKTR